MSAQQLAAAARQVGDTVAALAYYGVHRAPCQGRDLCSCGLTTALDAGDAAAEQLATYRPDDALGAVRAASVWQTIAREVAAAHPDAEAAFHRLADAYFYEVRP
jgi:hypothetical protein